MKKEGKNTKKPSKVSRKASKQGSGYPKYDDGSWGKLIPWDKYHEYSKKERDLRREYRTLYWELQITRKTIERASSNKNGDLYEQAQRLTKKLEKKLKKIVEELIDEQSKGRLGD